MMAAAIRTIRESTIIGIVKPVLMIMGLVFKMGACMVGAGDQKCLKSTQRKSARSPLRPRSKAGMLGWVNVGCKGWGREEAFVG